jgi:hypothetical protein
MRILLKESQKKRLQKRLKKNSIFFLCNNITINAENLIRFYQKLLQLNIKNYKVSNKLLKKILKKSIFISYTNTINGSIIFIEFKQFIKYSLLIVLRELTKYKINVLCLHFKP